MDKKWLSWFLHCFFMILQPWFFSPTSLLWSEDVTRLLGRPLRFRCAANVRLVLIRGRRLWRHVGGVGTSRTKKAADLAVRGTSVMIIVFYDAVTGLMALGPLGPLGPGVCRCQRVRV